MNRRLVALLIEVQILIKLWGIDYNHFRPPISLIYWLPEPEAVIVTTPAFKMDRLQRQVNRDGLNHCFCIFKVICGEN